MLVDDEAIVRDGRPSCIDWEANGFSVETLEENGARALAYMEKNPVDLAATEIKTPVLDGLELIRRARRQIIRQNF
ncbi:MAG: response regulator [Lachnospiraceae bacterium]